MSSISIIGSGNMASAIGALAVKGGNAVEIIGRDAPKAAALAKALGSGATAATWAPPRIGPWRWSRYEMCGARQSGHADRVCKNAG